MCLISDPLWTTSARTSYVITFIFMCSGRLFHTHIVQVLDVSQNAKMCSFKEDGSVMTLAKGSRVFVLRWGRELTPKEMAILMGFYINAYNADGAGDNFLRESVGDSMNVPQMGALLAVLLSLLPCR